ncbi:hypothetical protein Ancab_031410, partial [Ancistrocladus abbreviatus]
MRRNRAKGLTELDISAVNSGGDIETKIGTTQSGEIRCICDIDVGRPCKSFQAFANLSASYPGSCQDVESPNPNATSGGWPTAKDQISRA